MAKKLKEKWEYMLSHNSNNKLKTILIYLAGVILCIFILIIIMKLWNADLRIPFSYSGDTIETSARIKFFTEDSGYLINSRIGAPFGTNLAEVPFFDNVSFVILKILSLFFNDFGTILNIYFLLTFPLITISSIFVFRQFNFSTIPSIVGALLFTFLPYHFYNGEYHLNLSGYYVVPLIILVCIWIARGELTIPNSASLENEKSSFNNNKSYFNNNKNFFNNDRTSFNNNKIWYSVIIAVLVGCTYWYYIYFALFFIFIAGTYHFFNNNSPLNNAPNKWVFLLFGGIILASSLINNSQILGNIVTPGSPSEEIVHTIESSEMYGMKITQLLLPITGHRVSLLAHLKNRYNDNFPLINENDYSTLGIIGALGFMVLIINIFLLQSQKYLLKFEKNRDLINILSIFTIFAILFGTIGGFGDLIFLFFKSTIKYNCISIFIAFFSIFGIVMLCDYWFKRYNSLKIKAILSIALVIILIIGILDQTTTSFIPKYDILKIEFENDHNFVSNIEKTVPPSSSIFQLPYTPFPNYYSTAKMNNYDSLKGYLHSKTLKWSYGSTTGRYGDYWLQKISSLPLDNMVSTITIVGFQGVYIDTYGYADNGISIVSQLQNITRVEPIISNDKRLYYFDLNTYQQQLKKTYLIDQLETEKQRILQVPWFKWEGCFDLEGNEHENWRWCTREANLHIFNPSNSTIHLLLNSSFETGYNKVSNLKLSSAVFNDNLKVNSINKQYYLLNITLPPGELSINLKSDAARVNAPKDPRYLVFRVDNFQYTMQE